MNPVHYACVRNLFHAWLPRNGCGLLNDNRNKLLLQLRLLLFRYCLYMMLSDKVLKTLNQPQLFSTLAVRLICSCVYYKSPSSFSEKYPSQCSLPHDTVEPRSDRMPRCTYCFPQRQPRDITITLPDNNGMIGSS